LGAIIALKVIFTCGKQELWCLACKDYELGKENEREGE
jgi:hypothetical protein